MHGQARNVPSSQDGRVYNKKGHEHTREETDHNIHPKYFLYKARGQHKFTITALGLDSNSTTWKQK